MTTKLFLFIGKVWSSLENLTVFLGSVSGEVHCSFLLGFKTKKMAFLKKKKKSIDPGHMCHLNNNMVDLLVLPFSQCFSTICRWFKFSMDLYISYLIFSPFNSVISELQVLYR